MPRTLSSDAEESPTLQLEVLRAGIPRFCFVFATVCFPPLFSVRPSPLVQQELGTPAGRHGREWCPVRSIMEDRDLNQKGGAACVGAQKNLFF